MSSTTSARSSAVHLWLRGNETKVIAHHDSDNAYTPEHFATVPQLPDELLY